MNHGLIRPTEVKLPAAGGLQTSEHLVTSKIQYTERDYLGLHTLYGRLHCTDNIGRFFSNFTLQNNPLIY